MTTISKEEFGTILGRAIYNSAIMGMFSVWMKKLWIMGYEFPMFPLAVLFLSCIITFGIHAIFSDFVRLFRRGKGYWTILPLISFFSSWLFFSVL